MHTIDSRIIVLSLSPEEVNYLRLITRFRGGALLIKYQANLGVHIAK